MTRRIDNPVPVDTEQFATVEDGVAAVRDEQLIRSYEAVVKRLDAANALRTDRLNLFLQASVSRARGLHEGIADAVAASNPHAAVPLLRAFAETVAAVLYVTENPHTVSAWMFSEQEQRARNGPTRPTTGKLVDWMLTSGNADQFDAVYAEMCDVTHYGSTAWALPFNITDDVDEDTVTLTWSSAPHWKDDRQATIVCGWVLEIAAAMESALSNLGLVCLKLARVTAG